MRGEKGRDVEEGRDEEEKGRLEGREEGGMEGREAGERLRERVRVRVRARNIHIDRWWGGYVVVWVGRDWEG